MTMRSTTDPSRIEASRVTPMVIASLIVCYGLAWAATWLHPMLVEQVLATSDASNADAAMIVTAELAMVSAASFVISRFASVASLRFIALAGLTLTLCATLACLVAPSYGWLVALRLLAGTGEGALLMVASSAPTRLPHPDRIYGLMQGASALFGVTLLSSYSAIGIASIFPLLAACYAAMGLFVVYTPAWRLGGEQDSKRSRIAVRVVLPALSAFGLCLTSAGSWPFWAVLGGNAGLNSDQIGTSLAISTIFSLAGSFTATVMGKRFGRVAPIVAGFVILTMAMMVLVLMDDPVAFRASIWAIQYSAHLLLPYCFAIAAERDSSGRSATLVASAYMIAMAFGPYLCGQLIDAAGLSSLAWLALAVNILSLAVLLRSNFLKRAEGPDLYGEMPSSQV